MTNLKLKNLKRLTRIFLSNFKDQKRYLAFDKIRPKNEYEI